MDALVTSALAVGLAEIGDKTQLLTLLLVARYRRPWPVLWAILIATLINHGISAWLGTELVSLLDADIMSLVLGIAFVAVGLWLLKPDKEEVLEAGPPGRGVFFTAFVLFFLAEIGDKTQIATVLLGAQFTAVLAVTVGSTLGMLAANAPLLWLGQRFCRYLPVRWIQRLASLVFIAMGIAAMLFETQALSGW